jgi:alpha-galactosidase
MFNSFLRKPNNTSICVLLALWFFISPALAKVSDQNQIKIETKSSVLILSAEKNKKLYQTYYGQKLLSSIEYSHIKENHQAYVPAGMDDLFEPAIRMIHDDGNPSLDLAYTSHASKRINSNVVSTVIKLKDTLYPVNVNLHFEAYFNEDIIKTWTEIRHQEKDAVTLTNFASGMLHFDAKEYWLTQFPGDWAKEMRMQEAKLTGGIKIIDSKLGTRATMYQAPFFFLSLNEPSDEVKGEVIAGTIAWSGSFQLLFEIDRLNSLRVLGGMNPYASNYSLQPNESFVTPAFVFTYSPVGKGQASRNMHRWVRRYNVVEGDQPRMTLLNNWEATYFDFDETKLISLFSGAKKLGVDLFLLDDGWFGNKYPRNDAKAGLGDWQENRKKLPHGIGHLVNQAESEGIKFGIWLEPEMVNPKSELYEKHPEWILKLPNRKENYFRNQLVLDLTNPQVQQFVYDVVDDMLTKHPTIGFIKWDCNRMMTNTYSPYLKDRQSHIYIDYVNGLYKVLDDLREKYPHVPIMLCSGGGGRIDYGAMKYFTEFWPSDNTDPFDRIFIQWGHSYFFPANTQCCHITTMGKQSLKYRTDVAMMGKLGYDIRVNEMSPDELKFSQNAVKHYKRLSDVIWLGDLYRLISPYDEDRAVLMYVNEAKNKSVLFAYTLNPLREENFNAVKLQGLDPQKQYKIHEINLFPNQGSNLPENGKTFSGDYLMKIGINIYSKQPLTSSVIEITEITK